MKLRLITSFAFVITGPHFKCCLHIANNRFTVILPGMSTHTLMHSWTEHFWEVDKEPGCPVLQYVDHPWCDWLISSWMFLCPSHWLKDTDLNDIVQRKHYPPTLGCLLCQNDVHHRHKNNFDFTIILRDLAVLLSPLLLNRCGWRRSWCRLPKSGCTESGIAG